MYFTLPGDSFLNETKTCCNKLCNKIPWKSCDWVALLLTLWCISHNRMFHVKILLFIFIIIVSFPAWKIMPGFAPQTQAPFTTVKPLSGKDPFLNHLCWLKINFNIESRRDIKLQFCKFLIPFFFSLMLGPFVMNCVKYSSNFLKKSEAAGWTNTVNS